ncbi:MAG: hypothetical protein ACOYJ1_05780 [Peptococcales bacterium]|jgi:hypothetical protein
MEFEITIGSSIAVVSERQVIEMLKQEKNLSILEEALRKGKGVKRYRSALKRQSKLKKYERTKKYEL